MNTAGRQQLTSLIEQMDRPAIVVCCAKNIATGANRAAVRKYGTSVESGRPLNCPAFDALAAAASADLSVASGHIPQVTPAPTGDGHLRCYPFAPDTVMLVEAAPPQRPADDTPEMLSLPQFHVCYLHDLLRGTRSCSDPEQLIRTGIISATDDATALEWRAMVWEEDLPLYDRIIEAATKHEGNHRVSYRLKGAKGPVMVMDLCGTTRAEGKWPSLVGSIVSTATSNEQIRKLERQALAGRLMSGMMHDFKNLVAGISNMIEWCISQSAPGGRVEKALNKTIGYTHRAKGLLSTAPRLLSGDLEDAVTQVHLPDLVTEAEDLVRHILPAHIALSIRTSPSAPPILARQGMLHDLLLNLCINARDAMTEKGSRLDITVAPDSRDGELLTVLTVTDDGCGMPEEVRESIFEPFYTTKKEGTGLGLWMVREAVESFDGSIRVDSAPGRGTTFAVTFPGADGTRATADKPAARDTSQPPLAPFELTEPKTILFVEDDPLVRSGVSVWLENLGFDLLAAEDANQAWELFTVHRDRIDLIIQDFIIPGKRGDELLKDFLAVRADLPVIVVSAYTGTPGRAHLPTDSGAYAFVPKPFKIEDLVAVIRNALEI